MVALSETISLRVISCTQSNPALQQLTQFLPKLTSKLNIPITNDLRWHTVHTHPLLKKQSRTLQSIHRSHTRYELHKTTKSINNGKYTIKTLTTRRKINNKIHRNVLKRTGRVFKRLQQPCWLFSRRLISLTHRTILNKLLTRLKHVLPIEPFLHQF